MKSLFYLLELVFSCINLIFEIIEEKINIKFKIFIMRIKASYLSLLNWFMYNRVDFKSKGITVTWCKSKKQYKALCDQLGIFEYADSKSDAIFFLINNNPEVDEYVRLKK